MSREFQTYKKEQPRVTAKQIGTGITICGKVANMSKKHLLDLIFNSFSFLINILTINFFNKIEKNVIISLIRNNQHSGIYPFRLFF